MNNVQLCNSFARAKMQTKIGLATITDRVRLYRLMYLDLLRPYLGRVISYDHDILNAYSGIIQAQSRLLGDFHMALPVAVFGRALLLTTWSYGTGFWNHRLGFSSWSWLGWKPRSMSPVNLVGLEIPELREFRVLIHIYAHNSFEKLVVTPGSVR